MAKQSLTIYKLHFTSPVHLGDNRDDYGISLKTIASDTMYAAITSCLAKLGKQIPKNGDLGCSISSSFPFYQKAKDCKEEEVLFFPKPLMRTIPNLKDISQAKRIKKVSWLDKSYFEKVLNGNRLFEGNEAADIDNIKDDFLTDKEIDENFIYSQVSPRVNVSRSGEKDAEPFYMDRIYFKNYSGLYFIAKGDTSLLDSAMNLLQWEGIGTDRNIGNGGFEFEKKDIQINLPDNCHYIMALSSFIPESKEQLTSLLDAENIAYDFLRRGGWITTPPHNTIRKNVIYAFTEGSIFNNAEARFQILGKLVDLKPELDSEPKIVHPIWRNGKSIFVPIKL